MLCTQKSTSLIVKTSTLYSIYSRGITQLLGKLCQLDCASECLLDEKPGSH
jgi:hypothetical protein